MSDSLVFAAGLVAIVAATVAVSVALVLGITRAGCTELADTTGRAVQWEPWTGCYVEVRGELVPVDVWRSMEGEL